jgi:hypothetical protein
MKFKNKILSNKEAEKITKKLCQLFGCKKPKLYYRKTGRISVRNGDIDFPENTAAMCCFKSSTISIAHDVNLDLHILLHELSHWLGWRTCLVKNGHEEDFYAFFWILYKIYKNTCETKQ